MSVPCRGDDLPVAMAEEIRLPALAGASTAEELAERALRRLLRGGTWEALANERFSDKSGPTVAEIAEEVSR